MPGPLPNPAKRRRNAPTVSGATLPASGRKGRPPKPPESYSLGAAGLEFWRSAWGLPQATQWDRGAHYTVARRAQLEDDLAALDESFDTPVELGPEIEDAIRALKRLAGGSVNLMKEMRELDKRLGLDPKALAELRWTIVAEEAPDASVVTSAPRRLRAIDS